MNQQRRIVIQTLLLNLSLSAFLPGIAEEVPSLKVMTYNLRYASPLGENSWPTRRPLVRKIIDAHRPDVLGTQEGLYHQLRQMEADYPDYRWIGLGREGGSRGEFMAVFYRADRLDPLEFDHYWLSDTPEVINSATWGNSVRRMVTWIRFRDIQAKRDIVVVNTHFDHEVEPARQKSAALVVERSKRWSGGIPVILTGDFNTPAGDSVTFKTLTRDGGFLDAWDKAKRLSDRTLSFNGFQYPAPREGARIDWILHRGPIEAVDILIDDFAEGKQYPSDHFPVIATLRYAP